MKTMTTTVVAKAIAAIALTASGAGGVASATHSSAAGPKTAVRRKHLHTSSANTRQRKGYRRLLWSA
jgi:hypothetical protein